LWLTLDAGTFNSVKLDMQKHIVTLTLGPKNENTPAAYLHISQPAKMVKGHVYKPAYPAKMLRSAYYIPLKSKETVVVIK
jgi:hypothetical protein